ncbi:MAG: methyltransferase domain-containing protein [Proteobacteria bacterium]|nr:methyltransferase domain-containing protein [Pseudomonadota bacterium]
MPDDTNYDAWDLEALADIPNYQEWIISAFRPYLGGDAVEIGAGIGTLSKRLLPHVTRLDLVEPAANLVQCLEDEFVGLDNTTIVPKTLGDYLSSIPEISKDSAILVNVLEHIEDDATAMAGLFRLLRPGGHLLMFVPALAMLFSAMDTALGHYRRYGKAQLAGLARQAGFEVVSARYFDALGVIPWWVVYTLGGKTRFDPGASKLYDRLAVPVGRALETLIPPPLGKNVVLIARKPAALKGTAP